MTAIMTSFKPDTNGFNFKNHFKNDFIPALDIRTSGLCGGMSYAALDYYHAHLPIPGQWFRPANKTPLHTYLYDRQVTSIVSNLDKWSEVNFNPGGARNTEFFNWGISAKKGERIDELKTFLDHGIPAVICLKGDGSTGDHQVIAYGYDMGRYKGDLGQYKEDFKIFVCDPNHPNKSRTLIPDVGREIYHYQEGDENTWRTYFVDKNYHAQQPPAMSNANYPHDGLVYELILDFFTGNDDLRGGNDNVDLVVNVIDGPQQIFHNINLGARWIVNNDENAQIILLNPVHQEQIRSLTVSTTFHGGIGGDNWDMKSLTVHASGGGFHREVVSVGPKRFTGEDKTLLIPINGVSTPPGHIDKLWFTFQTGDDDLRGVNDNVNILIHYRGGQTQSVENANNGHRWPDNTTHQVEVGLNGAVLPSDIVQIDLRTTFTGGMGGDNWNMDSLSVRATGNGVDKVLVTHGFKRFTGDDKFLALPVVIANEEGHDAVWLGWQDLGGTIKAPPAVASWAAHRLDVFSAGMDGKLNHKWWDGSTWHNWETLSGTFKGGPAAVSWGANRIDVFVRGVDDHLGHLWWNGSQWNGWEGLGGSLTSAPTVSSWAPHRLDVFAAGADGKLNHKWWDGSTWHNWETLGGVFKGAPAAVSWGPNRIDVFVRGMDDHLGHLWWNGSQWNGWEDLGGPISSAPAVASWGTNRLDVFAAGSDGHLHRKWWNGSKWSDWDRIGGVFHDNPAAVSWGPNRIDVFVHGMDDHLGHLWCG